MGPRYYFDDNLYPQLTIQNYNKIMWIIDNMYLPKAENAQAKKVELLTNAGIIKPNYGIEHVRITDDDIEVVQQLAINHALLSYSKTHYYNQLYY